MTYWFILLSGAAGLIYEILWIKRAALAFGSSSLALSTVLAVFFLGLGLGSYLAGRVGRRVEHPLLWCAVIELLLGFYGLSNPLLFDWAEQAFGALYNRFELHSAALLAVRGGLIALLLLPPTMLMGATLPLFCRQLVLDRSRIAATIGQVYGLNTLGAALGCAAAGFLLLPALGITAATWVAVLFNLTAAIGFWLLARRLSPSVPERSDGAAASAEQARAERRPDAPSAWLVGLLFFLVGAVALGYELVWARFLTNFLRNSVYTYTVTLTAVLVGTVIGSLYLGTRYDRIAGRRALLLRFAALQGVSAALIVVLMHLPVIVWIYLKQFGPLPYLVLMIPPSIIAGASFPLLNRIVIADPRSAARQVGRMAALNILGCVSGSLVTGFVLLPVYGLEVSIFATTGTALAAGLLALAAAWFAKPEPGTLARRQPVYRWREAAVALAAAAIWAATPVLSRVRLPDDYIAPPGSLVDVTEGYNATLAVIRRGDANIMLVNQLWQGTSQKNHQIMAAHVPMLHAPDTKDVLVIGLGVGQTASRFLEYPVERLDIVDIEPRLFDFTRRNFASDWMRDSRVRWIPEDGRGYVKHSSRFYDLISVEVGQLYRPGVDVFYTREFYREADRRLRDGGIIVQFVPLEFLREPEFASILRTFLGEFPEARLWYNGNELLLLGFKGADRRFSPAAFGAFLERNGRIREDLDFSHWGGAKYRQSRFPVFVAGFLAGGAQLAELAMLGGSSVYTDDRPKLAYSISDFIETDLRAVRLAPVIAARLSPLRDAVIDGDSSSPALQEAATVRDSNIGDIAAANMLELIEPGDMAARPDETLTRLREVVAANPKNLRALNMMGELLVQQGRDLEALPILRRILELDESSFVAHQKMGLVLVRNRQLEAAIPHLERAVAADPNNAEALNTLAVALINLNRAVEAVSYFRRAAALEPGNLAAQRNLRNAEAMLTNKP